MEEKGHFLPMRCLEDILCSNTHCDPQLCSVILDYLNIDIESYKAYLGHKSTLAVKLAECFAKHYFTLFSRTPADDGWASLGQKLSVSIDSHDWAEIDDFIRYLGFIDRIYATCSNALFLDSLSKSIFNNVFILFFQEQILVRDPDPRSAPSRTCVQFLVFILENITSQKFAECIFYFLFGFSAVPSLPSSRAINECNASPEYKFMSQYNAGSSVAVVTRRPSHITTATVRRHRSCQKLPPRPEETREDPSSDQGEYSNEFSGREEEMKFAVNWRRDWAHGLETRNVDEYNVDAHKPRELSAFLFARLRGGDDSYAAIVWQLLDQLLVFRLPSFVKMLITDHMKVPKNAEVSLAGGEKG